MNYEVALEVASAQIPLLDDLTSLFFRFIFWRDLFGQIDFEFNRIFNKDQIYKVFRRNECAKEDERRKNKISQFFIQ